MIPITEAVRATADALDAAIACSESVTARLREARAQLGVEVAAREPAPLGWQETYPGAAPLPAESVDGAGWAARAREETRHPQDGGVAEFGEKEAVR